MKALLIFFIILVGLSIISIFVLLLKTPHASLIEYQAEPSRTTNEKTGPSLEEKVGQLFMVGHWANGSVASTSALITGSHIGGIIIMSAPAAATEISNWTGTWQAQASAPLLISIDQEGGPVTRLKGSGFIQTGQREIKDTTTAYEVGRTRGLELAALGINMNFSPVLDTAKNPDSFMYKRVFGNTEESVALASAMVKGMNDANVIAVPKHFPGHDDTSDDSHLTLPSVQVNKTGLPTFTAPFNELIESSNPPILMTAHVLFPQIDTVPATLSHFFLTEYLRGTLGFTGVIITDDMSMDAIDTLVPSNQAAVQALQAGADIILFAAEPERAPAAISAVLEAVANGTLSEARITESYDRVQALKEANL